MPAFFQPPGGVADLTAAQLEQWSSIISQWFTELVDDQTDNGGARTGHFFHPETEPAGADAVEKDITWKAFPRQVAITSATDRQRWRRADAQRSRQDEYCEWSVTRDTNNAILRITLTSEPPDYWSFLATVAPDKLLALYQQHVSPDVTMSDLFSASGKYLRENRWNDGTDGPIMHLIQANNTLGAEIKLASDGAITREINGRVLTGERELIECAEYGAKERHSDPHIGSQVNALARQDAHVSLANPVGLCIAGFTPSGFVTPDGADVAQFWKVTRGIPGKAVRAVFEVPADLGYNVSDITINGQAIEFGAQLVDFIEIKLTGLATRFGGVIVPHTTRCVSDGAPFAEAAAAAGTLSLRDLLARPAGGRSL